MNDNRPKTILCDIDGTLIKHYESLSEQLSKTPVLLLGIREYAKTFDWKNIVEKEYLVKV